MKAFDLGDILSITTHHLVSSRHVSGVYALLNYMTTCSLLSAQLPQAAEQCAPVLVELYPHLAQERLAPELQRLATALDGTPPAQHADVCRAWVCGLAQIYGKTLPVPRLPHLAEAFSAPIGDMLEMAGPDQEVLFCWRDARPDEEVE